MRTLMKFSVLTIAVCLLATEGFSLAKGVEDQPGYVLGEFIYEEAPFPSCHASTLAETSSGLVAAWFGGTDEKDPDVGIWFSRQIDGKWTAPVEVANGVESTDLRYPTWNPVLFKYLSHNSKNPSPNPSPADRGGRFGTGSKSAEGPLLLFYKVGPDPRTWWGMLITSDDNGQTWSAPTRLPDGYYGPIKNKPVQLANGDLLCPTSFEMEVGDDDVWQVYMERTPDLGKTWSKTDMLNDGIEIDAIQPSILFHSETRLQALGRSRQGRVWQMWSDDAGKSWGPMTLGDLPNPNSGTDAVTLADGRHLLVYNHTSIGRSPLNLAISEDGKTWQAALILEYLPGEYSYPAVIQSRDGKVHITYTWRRERIKHVVVDLAKLKPVKMTNGLLWPR